MTVFFKICLYLALLFITTGAFGQSGADGCADSRMEYTEVDSVKQITIFFRVDKSDIDPSYMDNEASLKTLREAIPSDSSVITHVAFVATTSPEGSAVWNNSLAGKRAAAVKELLREYYPDGEPSNINVTITTYSWSEMKTAVESDLNIPHREKLISILYDPSLENAVKGWRIKTMEGGATYKYLKTNVLDSMRTGVVTVTSRYRIPVPIQETVIEEAIVETPVFMTIKPNVEKDSITAIISGTETLSIRKKRDNTFALKTNLLFDLAGAPNIGVETSIMKQLSVTADFAYAYWRINNLYALQTIQGGVGAKYWFGPSDRPLTGFNAGIYGTYGGRYDVQFKDGYQGDRFWSAGLSAGYSMALSNRLNLELSLAGGYFFTPEARHYHRPENGHLLWDETRYNMGRFSLTKLQVNLVWLIGKRREK